MDFGFAEVAAITVICNLFATGVKAWGRADKWIPMICGLLGGILGVLAMSIMPDFPATDYISAVAIGIVSGLAATGVNQLWRQLNSTTDVAEDSDEEPIEE